MNDLDRTTAAQRGMLVLAVSEILREPHSEVRELALLCVMEYLRQPQFEQLAFSQVYLTAKALVEDAEFKADQQDIGIQVAPVLAECRKLLEEYYPQFKEQPNIQQLLRVIKLMGSTQEELRGARDITATDVFGIKTTPVKDKE